MQTAQKKYKTQYNHIYHCAASRKETGYLFFFHRKSLALKENYPDNGMVHYSELKTTHNDAILVHLYRVTRYPPSIWPLVTTNED